MLKGLAAWNLDSDSEQSTNIATNNILIKNDIIRGTSISRDSHIKTANGCVNMVVNNVRVG